MTADETRQEIWRDHTRKRLVEVVQDPRKFVGEAARGELLLVMLGAVALGPHARPYAVLRLSLCGAARVVGQREGLDAPGRQPGGERGREAGVDAAAQIEADRHVAQQAPSDARAKRLGHAQRDLFLV